MRVRLCSSIAFLAAAFTLTVPINSQDASSAKSFVESLCKNYSPKGPGTEFTGPRAHLYFHSSLLALMRADDKANGTDISVYADADLVCGCQDWFGILDLKIGIQLVNKQRTIARASFVLANPDQTASRESRRITLTLVPENGQWRIWNIVDETDPNSQFDVRTAILDDLQSLAKSHPSQKHP